MKMFLTMEVAHWAGCCMKFYDFNVDLKHFILHAICLRISSQCQGEYDPEKGDNLKLGFFDC